MKKHISNKEVTCTVLIILICANFQPSAAMIFHYNALCVIFLLCSLSCSGGITGVSSEPQGNESGRAVWRK